MFYPLTLLQNNVVRPFCFLGCLFFILGTSLWRASAAPIDVTLGCDFDTSEFISEMSDVNTAERISLEMNNSRKWYKNALNVLESLNRKERQKFIDSKAKKKFTSIIEIVYPFGICRHKAKVRLHGDQSDHISWNGGKIVSSLDVTIENASIGNIRKFKLFLPQTRGGDAEIVVTTILEYLGILSPRTRLIETSINGNQVEMLFQEKASKEFLEHFKRREGPIYEGDERFIWGYGEHKLFALEKISLARLVNEKWAAKGHSSLLISLQGFSLLQHSYQQYINDVPKACGNGSTFLDPHILANGNPRIQSQWQVYEIALMAANATHALRPHNRKFFFNVLEQAHEPIYYDGGAKFDRQLDQNHFECQLDQIKTTYSASDLKKIGLSLNQLDADQIFKAVVKRRFSGTQNDFTAIFTQFEKNASSALQLMAKPDVLPQHTRPQPLADQLLANIRTVPGVSFAELLKEPDVKNYQVKFCTPIDTCLVKSSGSAELISMMAAAKTDPQRDTVFWGHAEKDGATGYQVLTLHPSLTLYQLGKVSASYDEKNRLLTIVLEEDKARVMIMNSDLSDMEISVRHKNPEMSSPLDVQRFNGFGLTGCLTIFNSSLKNLRINAGEMGCEDGVNIIGSSGSIDAIRVTKAVSDAIDIDFSDLTIGEIHVTDAGNDCIDFSGGTYEVEIFSLNQCGDKAISVGEKSFLEAGKVIAENAVIGLSSKDSSKVNLGQFIGRNLSVCMEARNKKTEFFGGEIFAGQATCNGSKLYSGPNSRIFLEESLM